MNRAEMVRGVMGRRRENYARLAEAAAHGHRHEVSPPTMLELATTTFIPVRERPLRVSLDVYENGEHRHIDGVLPATPSILPRVETALENPSDSLTADQAIDRASALVDALDDASAQLVYEILHHRRGCRVTNGSYVNAFRRGWAETRGRA